VRGKAAKQARQEVALGNLRKHKAKADKKLAGAKDEKEKSMWEKEVKRIDGEIQILEARTK